MLLTLQHKRNYDGGDGAGAGAGVAQHREAGEQRGTTVPELLGNGDLTREILSRLPVRSVLRFRSVCKGWLAIISDREFLLSHSRRNAAAARQTSGFYLYVPVNMNRRYIDADGAKAFSVDPVLSEAASSTMPTFRPPASAPGVIAVPSPKRQLVQWAVSLRLNRPLLRLQPLPEHLPRRSPSCRRWVWFQGQGRTRLRPVRVSRPLLDILQVQLQILR